jgi:predicted nucleic acid-binding protein
LNRVIVVDTSLVVEVLLETPAGLRHAERVFDEERHVPALLDIEFMQVLSRLTFTGEIPPQRAQTILEIFSDWDFSRHPHKPLLRRIWELRSSVSAYDAAYVALAEALDIPLLTCDAKLSRSHGHSAKIVFLE